MRTLWLVGLVGFLLLSASCSSAQQRTRRAARRSATLQRDSVLLGTWMRSHEEEPGDNSLLTVWRNTKRFQFPPARGRDGFIFLPENKVVYLGIAPTDGTEEQPGRYTWAGPKALRINLENGRLITLTFKEFGREKITGFMD